MADQPHNLPAAARAGAEVVNMSLGSNATDGTDPLSTAGQPADLQFSTWLGRIIEAAGAEATLVRVPDTPHDAAR